MAEHGPKHVAHNNVNMLKNVHYNSLV